METLTIEQIYPGRSNQNGAYYPAKANGTNYNFDQPVSVGQSLVCEVKESKYTNQQGRPSVSRWAKIIGKPSVQKDETGNGRKQLNQFEFADVLEFYWEKLKPWELADEAKASVLCTCLIATADGRIMYEFPPDEVNPFAGEPGE